MHGQWRSWPTATIEHAIRAHESEAAQMRGWLQVRMLNDAIGGTYQPTHRAYRKPIRGVRGRWVFVPDHVT